MGIPPRRAGRQFRHPPDLRLRDARSASTETPPFPPPTRAARAYHHPCVEPPPSTTPSSPISRASFDPKTKARTRATRWRTRRLDRRVLVRVREHAPRRAPERALATSRARRPAERRRWTRPRTGPRRPYDRFEDAGRDWRQGGRGVSAGSLARLGDEMVTCNDRAPARRADATSAHGKQRTCALPVREYLDYARGRPGSDDPDAMARADSVLLKRVARVRSLGSLGSLGIGRVSRVSAPYFTSAMDHTRAIVEETHRRLLPRAPAGSAEATADGLDAALGKMFVGPAGTVTRMHQDAGEAHAWLAQVVGRKLFVCCPPDDAPALRVIEGETETAQSAVDPLDLSRDARVASAKFWTEARPVVFTLEPGGGGGDSARLVALRGRHRSRVDGDAQLLSRGDERGGARARHRGEARPRAPAAFVNSLLWKAHRRLLVPARCVSRPVRLIRRIFSCNSRTSS